MSSPFDDPLSRAFSHARDYLASLSTSPVGATSPGAELRQRFDRPIPRESMDPGRVIEDLVRDTQGGLTGVGSGRFFGWVVGGAVPAALAADLLAVVWDQVPGVHATSPAASIVEEVCGRWLLEVLDLPRESSFALVTGCQMAHVTCLAAARNALLRERGWDVEAEGLFGAPALRVLTGELCHGTLKRALRLLGLGTNSLSLLPCKENGEIDPEALAKELDENSEPSVVVLQAGELNTGAFDAFRSIIPLAKHHGAWVHIDGAFGLWARASSRYRELTEGVDLADSWATDGHKWLNVPYDCGYALVREPGAHRRAFSHKTDYLMQSESHRDAVDWTPEHSRRARGFATYAALRSLGIRGVEDMVNRCCRHARDLVEGARNIPGVEVVHVPTLNQGLLRFPVDREGTSDEASDLHTLSVISRLERSGVALFTSTRWQGRVCMRVSVSNWQTNTEDVKRVIEALRAILSSSEGELPA